VVILLAADASGPLLWLLVTSVFMLLRLCHLPQSGRHRTLPLVLGVGCSHRQLPSAVRNARPPPYPMTIRC
jgi:hypothetical protein